MGWHGLDDRDVGEDLWVRALGQNLAFAGTNPTRFTHSALTAHARSAACSGCAEGLVSDDDAGASEREAADGRGDAIATATNARLDDPEFTVHFSIVPNPLIGGLQAETVEAAALHAAAVVSMPTWGSVNDHGHGGIVRRPIIEPPATVLRPHLDAQPSVHVLGLAAHPGMNGMRRAARRGVTRGSSAGVSCRRSRPPGMSRRASR